MLFIELTEGNGLAFFFPPLLYLYIKFLSYLPIISNKSGRRIIGDAIAHQFWNRQVWICDRSFYQSRIIQVGCGFSSLDGPGGTVRSWRRHFHKLLQWFSLSNLCTEKDYNNVGTMARYVVTRVTRGTIFRTYNLLLSSVTLASLLQDQTCWWANSYRRKQSHVPRRTVSSFTFRLSARFESSSSRRRGKKPIWTPEYRFLVLRGIFFFFSYFTFKTLKSKFHAKILWHGSSPNVV